MSRGFHAPLLIALLCILNLAAGPHARVVRVPGGGIQPQVAVGRDGTVHLIYFKGEAAGGDVFYVRSDDEGRTFSAPLRVNSQPGSVIAAGTVRGAHLALGKNDRPHVAWMGAQGALPKPPGGKGAPMLYSRLDEGRTAFEEQRNVIQERIGLDGGGSIAADESGTVYVAWHAPADPAEHGEEHRRVWIARSGDEGATFSKETLASSPETGSCGCCGMRAFSAGGRVYLMYRGAVDVTHRDSYLVTLDGGGKVHSRKVGEWSTGSCPMSTASFVTGPDNTVWAAWEAQERVFAAPVDAAGATVKRISARSAGRQRFPALAINREGVSLLVWAEGVKWNTGGSVEWQVFDRDGKPIGGGMGADLPVWSLPAAYARRDGSFVILY